MTTCPRCAAALHPLADLARLALQTAERAGQGLHALQNRRIAVPTLVTLALQEGHLDGRILAARLACHAGTCSPHPAQNTGTQPPTLSGSHRR